ncbi:MAG: hypothetical protein CL678_05930 [Bdellovibrionaceae bacterium]|nr:hypothetical protein [Pseudobdellovibrionaceae bacterium]|tara:strand:+ start:5889 stop:6506 length:618 start_codon:yes stop_codon:yes gene_type:complete
MVRFLSVLLFASSFTAFGSEDLKLRNTYYYVELESDHAGAPKTESILTMKGKLIAKVSPRFKKLVDIEGTGKLMDGRIINYAGQINKEVRYSVVRADYGLGVRRCKLVPFQSIAVDRKVIPLGSRVRIEETIGMELPDGTIHDGYWWAHDIGGAIKKDRVDLFIGYKKNKQILKKQGIRSLQPLTISSVEAPDEDSCAVRKSRRR